MMGSKSLKTGISRPILVVSLLVISGILPVLLFSPEPAEGAILYVGGTSTYLKIQDAVDDAAPGDRIVIAPGQYTESITISVRGLTLTGNDTAGTVIDPQSTGPALSVNANMVTISHLTMTDGPLVVKADNFTGSELIFDIAASTGAVITSSKNVTLTNVTINNSMLGGIMVSNCTNVSISELSSSNSIGEVVNVTDTTSLDILDSSFSLGNSSIGVMVNNVTSVKLQTVTFRSEGTDNTGALLKKSTNILLDLLDSIVNSSALLLDGCRNTNIRGGNFIAQYKGSSGVMLDSCVNTTVTMTNFVIIGGQEGLSVHGSTDTQVDNVSFQIESAMSIGIHLVSSSRFILQDSNSVHLFEPSTLLMVDQSMDVRMITTLVSLISDGSSVAEVQRTGNFSMERNMFSSSEASSLFLSFFDGTNNCTVIGNLFDSSGEGSMVVHVIDSGDLKFMNNSITLRGNVSNGYVFENARRFVLAGEVIRLSGEGDNGIMIDGADFEVRDTLMDIIGRSSTGIMVTSSHNGSVVRSSFHMTGELSIGLMLSSVESDLVLREVEMDLTVTDGTGIFSENDNGRIEISDLMMNSSISNWYSIIMSRGTIVIDGLELTSAGQGIIIENCEDGWISDSLIDSTLVGSTFRQCTMNIVGSNISGVELLESSHITSIDSGLDPLLSISDGSQLDLMNTIHFTVLSRDLKPFQGVDIEVETWGNKVYQTPYFEPTSNDPRTDENGSITDMVFLDKMYIDTVVNPKTDYTNVTIHAEGTSPQPWDEMSTINASYPHTVFFVSPDIDLPATPVNFTVRQIDTKESLFLNWDPNSDDTLEYFIYSLDPDTGSQGIVDKIPSNKSSWTSGNLGPSKRLFFWITAYDGTWESETTELVEGTTKDLTPPAQPLLLSYENSTMNSITMSWTHAGEPDLAGFKVFMSGPGSMDFDVIATLLPQARTYTAGGLDFSTTYRYQVQAFDTSDNYSPFSRILQASTDLPMVEFKVTAFYSEEGPMAGLPASNCSLELVSFNGSVKGVTKTDENGVGVFIRRDPYESYSVRVLPPSDLLGEEGVKSGYLPAISDPVTVDPYTTLVQINLTMDYYKQMINGTIRLKVVYGEGPRSGGVWGANVELEHEDGAIVGEKTTTPEGAATFAIGDLPFRGRFRVTPPEDVAGDPSNNRSGYLGRTTNFFELTLENPDQNMGEVSLEYYSYVQEPEDLLLVATNPYGSAIDPESPIIIKFNQPVRTQTVIDSLQIMPALKNPVYKWSDSNKTLEIDHDGLVPETTYQITVGIGSRSEEGTSFPPGYQNNTWTFTTSAIPGTENGDDNSKYVIYAVVIGAILVGVIILIYTRMGSKKREEDELEKPYSSFGDYDDDDEEVEFDEDDEDFFDEDYPDDLAEQMDDDLPYDDEDFEDFDDDEDFEEDEDEFVDEVPEEEEDIDEMEEPLDEEMEDEDTEIDEPEEEMEEEMEELEPKPKKKKGKKKKKKRR